MNTMTISHRKWQLPVAVADLQAMKFHNPNDPAEAGETTFDVNVGTTPFRLPSASIALIAIQTRCCVTPSPESRFFTR